MPATVMTMIHAPETFVCPMQLATGYLFRNVPAASMQTVTIQMTAQWTHASFPSQHVHISRLQDVAGVIVTVRIQGFRVQGQSVVPEEFVVSNTFLAVARLIWTVPLAVVPAALVTASQIHPHVPMHCDQTAASATRTATIRMFAPLINAKQTERANTPTFMAAVQQKQTVPPQQTAQCGLVITGHATCHSFLGVVRPTPTAMTRILAQWTPVIDTMNVLVLGYRDVVTQMQTVTTLIHAQMTHVFPTHPTTTVPTSSFQAVVGGITSALTLAYALKTFVSFPNDSVPIIRGCLHSTHPQIVV